MSTRTLTWECESCQEEGSGLPPGQCPHCEADYGYIRLVLDEHSIPLILNTFNHLRERAENLADAMGYGVDSISFENSYTIDDSYTIEWEQRTCGCCPGDPQWEYIPIRLLLGTEEEARAHAAQVKQDRLDARKREQEAAAERARKMQESRERAMLRDLTAKYGGAS